LKSSVRKYSAFAELMKVAAVRAKDENFMASFVSNIRNGQNVITIELQIELLLEDEK